MRAVNKGPFSLAPAQVDVLVHQILSRAFPVIQVLVPRGAPAQSYTLFQGALAHRIRDFVVQIEFPRPSRANKSHEIDGISGDVLAVHGLAGTLGDQLFLLFNSPKPANHPEIDLRDRDRVFDDSHKALIDTLELVQGPL